MNRGRITDEKLWEYCSPDRTLGVRGVFSSGIYLADENGHVIMLHDEKYGGIPFGIAIDGFGGRGRELSIEAGQTAKLTQGSLCLGQLRIELYHEPEKHGDSFCPPELFRERAGERLRKCEVASLAVYSSADIGSVDRKSIEDTFAAAAYGGMELLEKGLKSADEAAISASLDRLLGLGRGLTPSCDDFITGVVYALGFYGHRTGAFHPAYGSLIRLVREKAPERTNIFSAAYLISACGGGEFSLMRSCLEGAQFDALLSVGSSSGADMLSGMCFAAALQKLA